MALAWGLASLQALFATERGEALAELEARRKALDFYAQKTLDMKLNQALERELKRIRDAAEDPLLPDDGLLLARAGLQVLPRPIIYRAGEEKPATQLYRRLVAGHTPDSDDDEPGSPWARRLELFTAFRMALSKKDTPKIERTFREILLLKAMFKLSAAREIPFTLALLEVFVENGSPDQDLMRAMLRDSLPAGPGREKIMGLQRALLTSREKFTRPDFDFLAGLIITLSEKSNVEHSNFSSRAQVAPSPSPAEPWPSGAPPMLVDSRWYVKDIDGDPHGVAVDLPLLLAAVADGMKELGLLAPEDSVALEGKLDHEQPAALMPVAVRLAKWDSALAAIARRYRLKTGLVFTTGFSAMAILALIAVAQRRKERFLAMKSDFVAAVSHELKTPLASARLLAETLERKLSGSPEARDYPARMVRQIDSLTFMVENILSFNRLDKGGWSLRKCAVNLEETLSSMKMELERHSPSPVEVRLHGLEGLQVEADPEMMTLLFMNLASNAVKHNTRSLAKIDVTARRERGVVLLFSDNGPGMPEDEWERVFTEFYRRPGAQGGAVQGSGLGLAICRRIMSEHGGGIRIGASGPDGTVFEITFA